MKKSLIAILLALAMALPMTGCSSSAKSTPTPVPADTSAPADTTPVDEGTTAPEGYLSDLVYQVASDPTFQDRLFEVTKLQSLAYTGEEIKAIFEQVYDEAAEIYGPID